MLIHRRYAHTQLMDWLISPCQYEYRVNDQLKSTPIHNQISRQLVQNCYEKLVVVCIPFIPLFQRFKIVLVDCRFEFRV